MAKKYIERKALLDAIRHDKTHLTVAMVFRHIHDASNVDVVEVVKCKLMQMS